VFFNASSGASTVTIAAGNAGAQSINCTGFTGTLTGTSAITVAGGITLVAAMGYSYTGALTITGSGTLTTAAKTLGSILINGSGIAIGLGDALTCFDLNIARGDFTTNNFNISANTLVSSIGGFVRSITLGSSTVTVTGSGSSVLNFRNISTLTFNSGTSTIVFTAQNAGLSGNASPQQGVVFNNVQFTNATFLQSSIEGINTFNDLTITRPTTAGAYTLTLLDRQIINGTLSVSGGAGNRRLIISGESAAQSGISETLVINSAPSLTDVDFRNIYVIGTAAPISGTRIGNLGGCRGISFSAPKTVFWVTAGSSTWSGNNWSATSGGAASLDNFPLAQDTAVINNTAPSGGTITIDTAVVPNIGTFDASARTIGLNIQPQFVVVCGDWRNGSGLTFSGAGSLTFRGGGTQTITSAGKTMSFPFSVESFGGTVQLADALNISTNTLTVTNGTFDTGGYAVTAGVFTSSGANPQQIFLRASTITLSSTFPFNFSTSVARTFDAGTSTFNLSATSTISLSASGITYNNVAVISTVLAASVSIGSGTVFNNLTISAPATAGVRTVTLSSGSITVNGTLTVSGASPTRRIYLRNSVGSAAIPTLTVNTLSAIDCDVSNIIITGAAAGSSPTRAGDRGGSTGINFPAPKTVYWNLSGFQNWSADGWASTSGGTPDVNNFPLAQDTVVFDNAGAAGTVAIEQNWALGTLSMGGRTTAMTLANNANSVVYGNWTFGTGVTTTGSGAGMTFEGRSTQTITSNGVVFNFPINARSTGATVQLADALTVTSTRSLGVIGGTFDAGTYNVTIGLFSGQGGIPQMGSGTWTLTGTGTVWSMSGATLNPGTADIVLSNTSTSARTFAGGGLAYNKLTIGGATGTSTLTITGSNTFTELASTKTVAHTIDFGTTSQKFGKWSVTGTAGNVVTLAGTGTGHLIYGTATSGIDYLAMGSIGFGTTSPGEFYAGANSTGTAGAPVFRTAPPAPRTLYWVLGNGNWSNTAQWSTSSGGTGGAAIPTSLDDVIFNAASNATAYTATLNSSNNRCKTLTIAGPASGNVTLAGLFSVAIQDSVTMAATGVAITFSGGFQLSGTGAGKVFITNGVSFNAPIYVQGIGASWELGSALTTTGVNGFISMGAGSFSLANYNATLSEISASSASAAVAIDLGSGTTTLSATTPIGFGTTAQVAGLISLTPGTSQINLTAAAPSIQGNGKTFNNVTYTGVSTAAILSGGNTFNNLTFNARASAGTTTISFTGTTTVTGTLSKPAGTDATFRHIFTSNTVDSVATLVCGAVSLTDVDFRDITISGAAAPASGTRLGDRKGNTGITFDAPKTVYWNLAGNQNWAAVGWATTIGGTPDVNNLPLAQDTAIFTATSPASGSTITFNQAYAVGTIDMSARTTDTLTLSITSGPFVTGNWINGTGTTLSGSVQITFGGRTTQTITSAGRPFNSSIVISSPGGSVLLQDAFSSNATFNVWTISSGTLDTNNYNVTGTSASSSVFISAPLVIGSGTWTLTGSGTVWSAGSGAVITGTGTITLTSASAKTFAGAGASYAGVTLNQGGAGTLTVTGDNTFADITNTFKGTGATTINFGNTTQRVAQWTAAGEVGRVLTIQGTSIGSAANLILTGATDPDVDYLIIQNVRAYAFTDTWYAGLNSVNNGSGGWYFSLPAVIYNVLVSEMATALDSVVAANTYFSFSADTAQALDQLSAILLAQANVSETARATDTTSTTAVFLRTASEAGAISDTVASDTSTSRSVTEDASAQDTQTSVPTYRVFFVDTAAGAESVSAVPTLGASVSDSAQALDTASPALFITRSTADAATGAETFSGALVVPAAYADSASAQDSQIVAGSVFLGTVQEIASISDSASSFVLFVAATSDSARALDTTSTQAIFSTQVAEGIQALDQALARAIFVAQTSDAGSASDSVQARQTYLSAAADSLRASETVIPQGVYFLVLAEIASGTDAPSSSVTVQGQVLEQGGLADTTLVGPSSFEVQVVGALVVSDQAQAVGVFTSFTVDFAQIQDLVAGNYLWNPIPNPQDPNWQIINNAQTSGWTEIPTM
jgi:hypothetical protein